MNLLITAILGGIFVSDVTAVGQFMISRPIFCGPVIGLLLGDIVAGLCVGVIMELLWIAVVPLGNAVPPDSTVVAVSATYIAASTGGNFERGYILFLLLCLVPMGILFKRVDMIHRNLNSFFSHNLEDKIEECDFSYIEKITYLGVGLFILKGIIFLLIIMAVGVKILPYAYSLIGTKLKNGMDAAFYIVPSIGLGTVITTFLFKRSSRK